MMRQRTSSSAIATATAAAILLLAAPACSAADGPDDTRPGTAPASAPRTPTAGQSRTPAAAPTPADSPPPPSRPPRAIPAVREFEPATGPGWRPTPGARVVTAAGAAGAGLADEARLLAGELDLGVAEGAAPGPGDIQLALAPKQPGGPESYTLTTRGGRVVISGPDQAGVFYGTRTLGQAVRADGFLGEGTVRDRPAKPQRGLHLDIARKSFTADWIEARVRELADLKLNQLALHFSDDQGFRIESTRHPEIVSTPHLTKAEVRRIVDLATRLHVTVIPEIDSPGHLGAVLRAHPALQLRDSQGRTVRGAVDISDPAAAKLVDELLREYLPLFPGRPWHLGADEYQALVYRNPEASFPQLAAAARQRYGAGATVGDLATGWLNDRAAVVAGAGRQPKAWNDGFFHGSKAAADPAIEVEYWTGKEIGARPPLDYLNAGRRLVNLNDEYLYYVLGQPNDFTYPTGRRIYREWTPLVLRGTAPVPARWADRILGARLAVWCDLAGAQTQAQVAAGIRLPLAALSQKVWDARTPTRTWTAFTALADELRRPPGP
ncbi:family 20 glycosylhydrolase [Streptomyces bambusae]|uniref:beta-N-acetylhexosaminidase n=1 Tax=Streptomyces bambusae TaxID=1550616 RepID=UPI001CFFD2BD|nr:glycoside hydrolase family 20 protein [Streptomyces bambusae]MCB5169063.1 family 20 glycosylhydrolase [Streptomyces bambusae]